MKSPVVCTAPVLLGSAKAGLRTVAVVTVRFPPEYGGPGIAFARLSPYIQAAGAGALILCRGRLGDVGPTLGNGFRVQRIEAGTDRRGRFLWVCRALAALYRLRNTYGPIHVFASGWLTFLIPILGRILSKRTSFSMTLLDADDPAAFRKTSLGALKLKLFNLYDNLIAINPVQIRVTREVLGRTKGVIEGSVGIDVKYFYPPTAEERVAARVRLGIAPEAKVAVFAGNISRRKGVDRAVDLWMQVASREAGALFVVKGPTLAPGGIEATLYQELSAKIDVAGLSGNFKFMFSPPDIAQERDLLHASDLYLCLSLHEGTPSAVMDAMACAVVPVLTPLKGFAGHIVRDGIEGLVLAPGESIEESAARVVELLTQEGRRRVMGEAGREAVTLHHSQEVALRAYFEAWGFGERAPR